MSNAAPHLVQLAKLFKLRVDAQDLRGKRRDEQCIVFFLGAAQGYRFAGDTKTAEHIETVCALSICTRGYSEVLTWAT